MAKKQLRIAIYETEKKVVEGNYGDFYNTISRTSAIVRIGQVLLDSGMTKKESGMLAKTILNEMLRP